MKKALLKIQKEFKKEGLLLLSDASLPSLTAHIAGEPIKGSWWGHPLGNLMYNISNQMEDDPQILTVKLINKKITYLDKKHWPALFTLAQSESPWQTKKLTPEVKKLLELVQKKGSLKADDPTLKKSPTEIGKLASKLEEKLLIYSKSIHTDSGKHIRVLTSWAQLAKELKLKPHPMTFDEAIGHFDKLKNQIQKRTKAQFNWPWE